MTSKAKKTTRVAVKDRILCEATRLFGDRGFGGVALRDIAKACDIPLSTLSSHFPRKQDLQLVVFQRAVEIVRAAQGAIGFEEIAVDEEVAKVSVIGVGMRSHAGVAKTMFGALAEKGVNIQVISTSEIKISVLIDAAYTELAVRALHAAYGLDKV